MVSFSGITKPVSSHVLRHTFAASRIKEGILTRALMQLVPLPANLISPLTYPEIVV